MLRKIFILLCLGCSLSYGQSSTTLTAPHGGTGDATLTAHGVLIGEGTAAVNVTTAGTANQVLQSNGPSTDPSWTSAHGSAVYGDGSDGALVYDGTTTILGIVPASKVYTLGRDIFPSSMTVSSGGVTVVTNGYRIYCTGTLLDSGTISNNGNPGANQSAGAATSTNSLGTGLAGGAGGSTGVGGAGNNATGAGGNGGAGGISGAGQAGGSGGTEAALGNTRGGSNIYHSFWAGISGGANGAGAGFTTIAGGSGGGGGGGSGANNGGGGGGGGGVVLIDAYKIDNTAGAITANGGKGGNGTGANGGSGGGGGGGVVFFVCHTYVGTAATATGGVQNTTVTGTGVAGVAGSNGNVITIFN